MFWPSVVMPSFLMRKREILRDLRRIIVESAMIKRL